MNSEVKVSAYFLCYNEENILPHLIKYYSEFCSKITILDNQSTDSSVEIARSFLNVEVIHWDSGNELRDDLYLQLKNNVWKKDRGFYDYVIVGDADEFLYHPKMKKFLQECKSIGITMTSPKGYYLIADEDYKLTPSSNLLEEVQLGIYGEANNKSMMFSPNLSEINYAPGCHRCSPVGDLVYSNDPSLKVLHYKYLGVEDFIPKQLERGKRLSEFNKKNGFGSYYLYSAQKHLEEYKSFVAPGRREKVI